MMDHYVVKKFDLTQSICETTEEQTKLHTPYFCKMVKTNIFEALIYVLTGCFKS